MAPGNKIFVKSTSDANILTSQTLHRKGLDQTFKPTLFHHLSKTIVKACERELDLINQAKNECQDQLEGVGKLVLEAEVKQFDHKERARRAQFMCKLTQSQAGMNSEGISSVVGGENPIETVEKMLSSMKGPVTSARLAKV